MKCFKKFMKEFDTTQKAQKDKKLVFQKNPLKMLTCMKSY